MWRIWRRSRQREKGNPRDSDPIYLFLCCGSESGSGPTGSTCFWASWIRIRIFLSLSKNSKKNRDLYCFVTSFWLFTFKKMMLKYLQKVICRKSFFLISFSLASWRSMMKIEGSTPKCHGSAILIYLFIYFIFFCPSLWPVSTDQGDTSSAVYKNCLKSLFLRLEKCYLKKKFLYSRLH